MASRVQLALPDPSLCAEADNDEDGEEKLKPARRSRNPAKPADPKFPEAKRASDNDQSDTAAAVSDKDEKVKPACKGSKPKATAPARKSRAPVKKTPKHDYDADVEAPLSANPACMYVEAPAPSTAPQEGEVRPASYASPVQSLDTSRKSRFVTYKMAFVNFKLGRARDRRLNLIAR